MRILIVDDEPDVLMLCRVNLEHAGHEVAECENGTDALARAAEWLPDLIVLDVMLPGRDGFAVLAELRERPATRDVPVVMLTAKVQREDQIRGWSAGANGYLTKPFSPIDLSEAIEQIASMSVGERAEHRNRTLDTLSSRP
ncbi:MAG: response regulator [Actinomycetota bacterium]